MSEQIPINENMSDDLKAAISYLNENNISLTDKINVDEEIESLDDDSEFDGTISDDAFEDSDMSLDEDELDEDDDVDMSDLDSIF